MLDKELRSMIGDVKDGRMDRRGFIQRLAAVGLTAPLANQILALGGVAMAEGASTYKPTKRGGGGALKLLWWQGPTLLNPHFATGTKDQDGARLFYEPLACWDPDGNMKLVLAAEIPSIQNGGLAADGKSVTWKLKPGVKWHDGTPFTADDVVFNWEYAKDPATSALTIATLRDITVEKVDDLTVRVLFNKPTPFWADAFVGAPNTIIPKHLFKDYMGSKSREAPTNLSPVGTGPYKFVEFKPGDLVRGVINPDYHMANRPYFDSIEMKGGGDAVSAARAVIQTGEYDFGWNIQVEDDVLLRLEKGGKGKTVYAVGGDTEFIALNFTDPNTEVDGERSSMKTKHPLFSDPAVRKALSLLIDREFVKKAIYGRAGRTTANFLNGPEKFVSKNTTWEFSIEKASKILDDAGWKPGADGIREKDGKKLKLLYQTCDQRAAPEDAGHRQAGLPEGGHRRRAEIGRRLRVLLLRRRQSRYLFQVLRRHGDVPDPAEPARSVAAHASLPFEPRRHQGEQVAGHQLPALGQQGVRRDHPGRGRRDGSSQARGVLHQGQRPHVSRTSCSSRCSTA